MVNFLGTFGWNKKQGVSHGFGLYVLITLMLLTSLILPVNGSGLAQEPSPTIPPQEVVQPPIEDVSSTPSVVATDTPTNEVATAEPSATVTAQPSAEVTAQPTASETALPILLPEETATETITDSPTEITEIPPEETELPVEPPTEEDIPLDSTDGTDGQGFYRGMPLEFSGGMAPSGAGNGPEAPQASPPTQLLKWGYTSMDTTTRFKEPSDVALDNAGNIYVADSLNHKIKKYSARGVPLLTFGQEGWQDGSFEYPASIAVSSSGLIYVLEFWQQRVQKFSANGAFLASWGSWGSSDGQFKYPIGIALDAAGNVYVADRDNARIQKFNSNGIFITKWGTYGDGNSQFHQPTGIAVDKSNNVFVVDIDTNLVKKFSTTNGVNYTYITKFGGWPPSPTNWQGYFINPKGIDVDGVGNLYISEESGNRIQKMTRTSNTSYTYATSWGSAGYGNLNFNLPQGVAVNSAGTTVVVADTGNHRVKVFNKSGTVYAYASGWGSTVSTNGLVNAPRGISVASNGSYVYLADTKNHRVQIYNGNTGSYVSKFGSIGIDWDWTHPYLFFHPLDVARDKNGYLYVADAWNNRIEKFNSSGTTYLRTFGRGWGTCAGCIKWPTGVALDNILNLYVVDNGNCRVSKFDKNGVFKLNWGTCGSANGQFSDPNGIAIDSTGNVYIADSGNNRIQKFSAMGSFLAAWGVWGYGVNELRYPRDVVVDALNRIYVADTNNNRIVVYNSSGTYLTHFGRWGNGNGQFNTPVSVAVDANYNVYVADRENYRLLKFANPLAALAPSTPVLTSPSGTITTALPTYTWNTASNATRYSLKIDDGDPMPLMEHAICNGASCTIQPYIPLSNASHTWQVVASNSNGNSSAASGSFTVNSTYPKDRLAAIWGWSDLFSNGKMGIPIDIAADGSGNSYVVDSVFDRVIKFDSAKNVLFEWGANKNPDWGQGSLSWPNGVGLDSSGNVYITTSNLIQKFDANGNYLTQFGDDHLGSPTDVAVDGSGNVYIADDGNSKIFKYTFDGTSYTYAAEWGGDGSGDGQFNGMNSIAVDSSGNVYAVDINNHRVQKFDSSGTYLTQWGSYGNANGQFIKPLGVTLDSSGSYVYVVDDSGRIQKFSSNGVHQNTWAGSGTGDGQLSWPQGIAVDSSNNLLVADADNARIQKFDASGVYQDQWGTDWESTPASLSRSNDLAASLDGSRIYVLDSCNQLVKRYDSSGTYIDSFGGAGSGNGQFRWPSSIALDSSGNVFITDDRNHRVQKFTAAGIYVTQFGSYGSGDGQFKYPYGVAVDSEGAVYVVDNNNHRVQKFTSLDGLTYSMSQQWGSQGSDDGQFNYPSGIVIDGDNNLYVVDSGNSRIQKFNSSGVFLTKWGSSGDGNGKFCSPSGIGVDLRNNVYVADSCHDRIQVFSSTGVFLASQGSWGRDEGKMHYPRGVTVDVNGNVYVADFLNYRVLKYDTMLPPLATTLVSPTGTVALARPTFTWNAVAKATHYQLWIKLGTTTKLLTLYTSTQTSCAAGTGQCSLLSPLSLTAGAYTWFIRPYNSVGYGPWSSGMTFSAAVKPLATTLVLPTGTILTTLPTFTWNAVPGTTYYTVLLKQGTRTIFNRVYTKAQVKCALDTGRCTLLSPLALTKNLTYTWQVQTRNAYGYGPLSLAKSFIIR